MGHHVSHDIEYLRGTLDIDLDLLDSIVTTIDTQQVARQVFNFSNKYISLRRTLTSLGIKARQQHNSGNDAVYTLRAMLHLFCNWQEDAIEQARLCIGLMHCTQDVSHELLWWKRIDVLREVARCCPRPMSMSEVVQAAKPPKPARVEDPDLFETAVNSDGQMEGGMVNVFDDGS